jgi:hypothetical protein
VPEDALALGRSRPGEGNRSWSAGAGSGALAVGIAQASWTLRAAHKRCPSERVYVDWSEFKAAGHGLFLWEAFVTAKAKALTHVDDATVAVGCFCDALPEPDRANAVLAERPFSLIGAIAIWSGWNNDLGLMQRPCLVLKAAPSG